MAAGALSILKPLRFLDIGTRKAGFIVFAAAVVTGVTALNWPAPLVQPTRRKTQIDQFMPAHHVAEYHTVRVHASPHRVWDAMPRVTFTDVPIFAILMQIRVLASGSFRRLRSNSSPILQAMTTPPSGFIQLAEEPGREVVLGLAGKFWGRHGPARISSPREFLEFNVPGSAKSVSNLSIEDLGNGWSQLSTETRGIGTDDEGHRTFARY